MDVFLFSIFKLHSSFLSLIIDKCTFLGVLYLTVQFFARLINLLYFWPMKWVKLKIKMYFHVCLNEIFTQYIYIIYTYIY